MEAVRRPFFFTAYAGEESSNYIKQQHPPSIIRHASWGVVLTASYIKHQAWNITQALVFFFSATCKGTFLPTTLGT